MLSIQLTDIPLAIYILIVALFVLILLSIFYKKLKGKTVLILNME